jgi:hypothetical protein
MGIDVTSTIKTIFDENGIFLFIKGKNVLDQLLKFMLLMQRATHFSFMLKNSYHIFISLSQED